MEVKSIKPVSQAEAMKLLEDRKKDSDLDYEQVQALEHAEKFKKFNSDKEAKLAKELMDEFNLAEETAIKILDIHPIKAETLKAILMKDKVDMEDAGVENILKKIA